MNDLPLFQIWDGSYYISRAISVLPPKHTDDFSFLSLFLSMVYKDIQQEKPKYFCMVFDYPGVNFRHQLSEDYKINLLTDNSEDIKHRATCSIKQLLDALGFPVIRLSGVEGDDVLYSLTRKKNICGEPVRILVMTGDKDMAQLVNSKVTLCNTREKPVWYGTPDTVLQKYGVSPKQVAYRLALMGDANDGVGGIHGIGGKKAQKIISKYPTPDDFLNAPLEDLKEFKLTHASKEEFRTSLKLVDLSTVRVNVAKYKPFYYRSCNVDVVNKLLKQLNLKSTLVDNILREAALSKNSLFSDALPDTVAVDDIDDWSSITPTLFSEIDEAQVKFKY